MIFDPIMSLINGLRTKVGNAALTTTAQDLSGGVNELNDQKVNQETQAYVINGDTYTGATIPNGSYVFWDGVLYTANGAIPAGNVSAANFSNLPETGGLNSLYSNLSSIINNIFVGKLVASDTSCDDIAQGGVYASNRWTNYPTGYGNNGTLISIKRVSDGNNSTQFYLDTNGHISVRFRYSNGSYTNWTQIV